MDLKVGDKIVFESGGKYEIVKLFTGGFADLKSLTPLYSFFPNYYPVYYSIKLENFKLIK